MPTTKVTLNEALSCGVGDDVIVATSLGRVAATVSAKDGLEYTLSWSALPQGLLNLNACDVLAIHCGKLVEGYACVALGGEIEDIESYDPSANNGAVVVVASGQTYMVWPDGGYVLLGGGGGGVGDHGLLTGLGDDDHPQYHTDARGDARYAPLAHASSTSNPHGVTATQVGLPPASKVEMETGTETGLRSMSPLRVAQAIAAQGGGGSGGWFATMNAANLIGALSTSPIGYAAASLATVDEENFGAGLQSSDSTQRSDTIGLEFPIPDFVTAYDDAEAVRIRYFADSTNGDLCKLGVEVIGKTTGGSDTSLYSTTVTPPAQDETLDLKITAANLGATIYAALLIKLTFYSESNNAVYVTSISVRGE